MKRKTMLLVAAFIALIASGMASAGTITVDGVVVKNDSNPITTTQTYSNKTSVVVSGCVFQDISAAALAFTNVNTVTLDTCDFTNINYNGAIGANGCDLVQIIDCDFTQMTGTAIRMPNVLDSALSSATKNVEVIIDGATINGVTGDAMNLYQMNDLTITNCEVANCTGYGIKLARPPASPNQDQGYILAMDISNNYIHHINDDGILGCEDAFNAVLSNNEICDIAYDGVGAKVGNGDHPIYWQGPGAVIRNNYIHDNHDGEDPDELAASPGCGISYRTNVDVIGNIVHSIAGKGGIAYWSDHPGSGTSLVENNVVYDCNLHGIWMDGIASYYDNNPNRHEIDCYKIYHNTVYMDCDAVSGNPAASCPIGWEHLSQPCTIYCDGNVLALNNSKSDDETYYIYDGPKAPDDGYWFFGVWIVTQSWPGETVYMGDDNILTPLDEALDATFVDYANRDFRLNSGSLAVNTVANDLVTVDFEGHTRPGNGANDAGAFEYGNPPTELCYGPDSSRCYTFPEISENAPTLSAISPTSGSTAGGTACTLTGTNFISGASVSFGGNPATSPNVVSSTSITCSSPSGSAGAVNVTVTTSEGTSGSQSFTYIPPAPTLDSITPTSGYTAGGTACTLAGSNFIVGATSVAFGGTGATGITVDSSSQVRCTSPAKTVGTYSVTATTSGGTSNGVNFTYTTGAPSYTTTLYASADSYVRNTSSNTNFGTITYIRSQKNSSTDIQSYLKFDLSSVQGSTVTSATLKCYLQAAVTSTTVKAYSCSTDSWIESGTGSITWANKPAAGTQQASKSGIAAAGYYDWDITSFINSEFAGDKLATVILRDDSSPGYNINAVFSSREYTGTTQDPLLVVISQ